MYVPTRIIQIPVHLIFRFSYEKRCHTRFRCIPRNDCDYYYVKWKVKLNSVPKFAPIWYHYIKPQQIHQLSKFIQQRREEPIERFSWIFSLRFSQFSYPFISSTSNYVNITLFDKALTSCRQYLTVRCKYRRENHISRRQEILSLILFFIPDINVASKFLCFVEQIVGSIFLYLTGILQYQT